ncbi:hypothetical protein BP6252_07471 [Coleophoma cylindrospora]|uniref:Heterokaryon incompatibility domain-containing protein n=1 Tax=Coleophoma cylindrospora TaxID=1849047 RepID=A0A3D8RI48_9HELO|nr:hypothetical protein BP6252_07471 [Coleophoma cylindrospora]
MSDADVSSQEVDGLCSNCCKVDTKGLFLGDRHPHTHHERLRTFVGNLGEILTNSSCPLCRLISSAVLARNLTAVLEESQLDSHEIDCFFEPWRADVAEGTAFLSREMQDLTATSLVLHLQVHGGEFHEQLENFTPVDIKLHSSNHFDGRPLLNGAEIAYPNANLKLAKECIQKCQELHGDTCRNYDEILSHESYRSSFLLIDIENRTVLQLDPLKVEFAALSYVWGYNQDQYASIQMDLAATKAMQCNTRTLPTTLPKTIEDAMIVCSLLELRYLWVDLFCVDQTASAQQKIQLMHMGSTYGQSTITIISAYGENSQAGLPGVQGYQEFRRQCREQVAGWELITGLPTLSDQMNESKWGTRGWTFQEGLLSTRCLIFGGYEPIFCCRKALCRESLQPSPMDYESDVSLDISMGQLEHFPLSTSIFHSKDLRADEWTFGDYTQIVKGYLLRDLTRNSDTLTALTGYLEIVTQRTGVQFIWGLPADQLVDGLAWFGRCYSWLRVEGNPSWSWAGWGLSWHNWPFFASVKYNDRLFNGHLPSSVVHLSGDDYPEHRPANRVCQTSAIVSVCPGHSQKRLKIESYVAKFELEPLDLEQQLQHEGPDDAIIITPTMSIVGANGPVDIHPHGLGSRLEDLNEFTLSMPYNMSMETFQMVMTTKMDFLMLKRWRTLEEDGESFNYVLAMLVDRREGAIARRMGIMAIPAEEWDLAGAQKETVFLE